MKVSEKKQVVVEIRGIGTGNIGSVMMLLTLLEQIQSPKIKFTVCPQEASCEYTFYSKLGLFPKFSFAYKKVQLSELGKFLPRKWRRLYGLVINEEVDVIVDTSGFAYSSLWGENPARILSQDSRRYKKLGKSLILLPQAFGPFQSPKIKNYMREIIENATLIYARDIYSYTSLKEIKDAPNIKICPDFTILMKGVLPPYFNREKHQICVVPNQRMKDKTDRPGRYIELMRQIITQIQSERMTPFFLIFGGDEDVQVAREINALLNNPLEIINETNPQLAKGIIENSRALIGSRYHSLVCALQAGVPVIGTGWSHKYYFLFQEFKATDRLIDINLSGQEIRENVSRLLKEAESLSVNPEVSRERERVEAEVKKMFREVLEIILSHYPHECSSSCRW
ncbi:MAG: polysaccharide pyruvyl transferase family protein [Candidatus Omnitrophica bacterium]|nr:polysaccharide pyruvyl transferase family protein [Candidatus Omnitrophota bacterium]